VFFIEHTVSSWKPVKDLIVFVGYVVVWDYGDLLELTVGA
jgi:hypothetical protein